jgi:hypothetical protein
VFEDSKQEKKSENIMIALMLSLIGKRTKEIQ